MTIGPAATGLSSDGAGVAARCIAMANVGGYRVVDAVYRNGLSLPTHTHPQPELSFVTRGSFRDTTRRGEAVCTTGMLHVLPSEEPHSNQFDVSGSRITIIDLPLAPTVADRRTRRLLGRSAVIHDG